MKPNPLFALCLLAALTHPVPTLAEAKRMFAPPARDNAADPPPHRQEDGEPQAPKAPEWPPLQAAVCVRPSVQPLIAAFAKSGAIDEIRLRVYLSFDASGTVHDARLETSSGDEALDAAARAWALRVRICPGAPGQGIIPLHFFPE